MLRDRQAVGRLRPGISHRQKAQGVDLARAQARRVLHVGAVVKLQRLLVDEMRDENQVADISDVAGATQLRRVFLMSNQVSDVSGLGGLDKVRSIDLRENPKALDLGPRAGLALLEWIGVGGDGADVDLSALAGLEILRTVVVENGGSGVIPYLPLNELKPAAGSPRLETNQNNTYDAINQNFDRN